MDAPSLLAEATCLWEQGKILEAKSSLVVAGCLFPDDASLRFEHWRLCLLGTEDKAASRILAECRNESLLKSFCNLLLRKLREEDASSIARAGCLKDAPEVLSCCLSLLPAEAGGDWLAEEIWSTLLNLTVMSSDNVEAWWRAAEFSFALDAAETGVGHKRKWGDDDLLPQICTNWSALLSGRCLIALLGSLSKGSSGGAITPAEVLRIKPFVERAALHHVGAGQWRDLRALVEAFTAGCPLDDSIRAGAARMTAGARCASHAVALAVCGELDRGVGEEAVEMKEHVAAAAHIAILGSFMEGLFLYAHACCPAEAPGAAADDEGRGGGGVGESVEDLLEPAGAGAHGWFLVQVPPLPERIRVAAPERLGQKHVRAVDSEDGGVIATGRQLSALSLLWTGLQHKQMAKVSDHSHHDGALWVAGGWVWEGCLADILWYKGDVSGASRLLGSLSTKESLPPLARSRFRLQLALCTGGNDVGSSVGAVLTDLLAAGGGSSLRWYTGDKLTIEPAVNAPEHVPCQWGEIVLQCLLCMLHSGSVGSSDALVLSQISWPRLGRYCAGLIQQDDFELQEAVSEHYLSRVYNVEVLERLFAAVARDSKAESQPNSKIPSKAAHTDVTASEDSKFASDGDTLMESKADNLNDDSEAGSKAEIKKGIKAPKLDAKAVREIRRALEQRMGTLGAEPSQHVSAVIKTVLRC